MVLTIYRGEFNIIFLLYCLFSPSKPSSVYHYYKLSPTNKRKIVTNFKKDSICFLCPSISNSLLLCMTSVLIFVLSESYLYIFTALLAALFGQTRTSDMLFHRRYSCTTAAYYSLLWIVFFI